MPRWIVTSPLSTLARRGLVLVVALWATRAQAQSAAAAASPRAAGARAQIDSINAEYIRAYAAADVDRVIALYDTAATELLEQGRVVRGRAALMDYWRTYITRSGPLVLKLETTEFWLVDDTAYETGRYSSIPRAMIGHAPPSTGNYATVWRRQRDGGWKMLAVFDTPR